MAKFSAPAGYIIGAAKCGTTTLADVLATHPDIGLCEPKEPDFFGGRFDLGFGWYQTCFDHVREKRLHIDASTSYAAALADAPCATVAARIRAARPDARLVYIVRDPVTRAWSSYWHAVRAGEEKRDFATALNDVASVHIRAGLYHARLCEFLRHFPEHAILLVDFRELAASPIKIARKVATFLGADPDLIPPHAQHSHHRNASFRWNHVGHVITKTIGLERVRALTKTARLALPKAAFGSLRRCVSQPTPQLSLDTAHELANYFTADAAALAVDFGMDVRCGTWWSTDTSRAQRPRFILKNR